MPKKRKRGKPQSSWHVARRCLVMLRRLQQGPATKAELLAAVRAAVAEEGDYGGKRFDNDKRRLFDNLGVKVRYSRRHKGYVVDHWEKPLINLSDDDLETLAFLSQTFQADSPRGLEVQQLIDRLVAWLPDERAAYFDRIRKPSPDVDLRLRDDEEIAPDVWTAVQEAWQARRYLAFDYQSRRNTEGVPRHHVVQPWEFVFTERGHYQLLGYCTFVSGEGWMREPNDYVSYRPSRMVPGSVQVLPQKLPGVRPRGNLKQVVYQLSPKLARFGVSRRRELVGEPAVTTLEDGWVQVEGETHDVFGLARSLLYYGGECRVVGGRELLDEVKNLVQELSEGYR